MSAYKLSLAAAVKKLLPEVQRQRVHGALQRGVVAKGLTGSASVAGDVSAIFQEPGLPESKEGAGRTSRDRWHKELCETI